MDLFQLRRRRRRRRAEMAARALAGAVRVPAPSRPDGLLEGELLVLCLVITTGLLVYGRDGLAWLFYLLAFLVRGFPTLDSATGRVLWDVACAGMFLGIVRLAWCRLERRPVAELGLAWGPASVRQLLLGVGLGTAGFLASAIWAWRSGLPLVDAWLVPNARYVLSVAGAYLLSFVAIAVGEEVVFRGYLLQRLTRSAGPWVGMVVSSVILAAQYLASPGGTDPLNQLSWFLGGLSFALARLGSGALWLPIGMNFAGNFVSQLLFPNPTVLPPLLMNELAGAPTDFGDTSVVWADIAMQLVEIGLLWRFVYQPSRSRQGIAGECPDEAGARRIQSRRGG